jgi:hypothetical protein
MPASELSPSIVPAACDPPRHLWQGNEADHGSATLKDTTYTYEGADDHRHGIVTIDV